MQPQLIVSKYPKIREMASSRSTRRNNQFLFEDEFQVPSDEEIHVPDDRETVRVEDAMSIDFEIYPDSPIQIVQDQEPTHEQSGINISPESSNETEVDNIESLCATTLSSDIEAKLIHWFLKYRIPSNATEELITILNKIFGYNRIKSLKSILSALSTSTLEANFKLICNCNSKLSFNAKYSSLPRNIQCSECGNVEPRKLMLSGKRYYVFMSVVKQIQSLSKLVKLSTGLDGIVDILVCVDSVPVNNSSSVSFTPLLIYIDGIHSDRLRNVAITSCFYASDAKPDYSVLFEEFIYEYNAVYEIGFQTDWHPNTRIRIKSFIADAVCRASVLNLSQFNGSHGCHRCYI